MNVQDEIEEHLELVAATAIEDKLQDQVGNPRYCFPKIINKIYIRFHNKKPKASRNKNMGVNRRQN